MRGLIFYEEYRKKEVMSNGPYTYLHIYYLQGQVTKADEQGLGEHFLGNWVEDNTSFLFFSKPAEEVVSALLRHRSNLELIDYYEFTYEDWQGEVPQPIRVGKLLFVPPWSDIEAGEDEISVVLDPGVVFGTGLHPTTKDCLRAMMRLRNTFQYKTVLDLGTGTGILALAAVALGAKQVMAVDLNPLAVKTAQNNALLNHFDENIQVMEGKAEDFVNEPADLLIANIHHNVLMQLIKQKGFRKKKRAIISGLMRSQVRDVAGELQKNGFKAIQEWDYDMTWYTMLIKNECLSICRDFFPHLLMRALY